jgi:hypothetical protein
MRLVFLVGVTIAGLLTQSAGTRIALLVAAGLIAAAGVASIAWGRRVPVLGRVEGNGSG